MILSVLRYWRESWVTARAHYDADTEILRTLPPASAPGISITEIAARTDLAWSECYDHISRLIERGWVRRAPATVPDPVAPDVYWDGFYIIDSGIRQLALRDQT